MEGEEETETSALFNEEEKWRGKQEDVHASAEKARERFENEVSKIGAMIQLVVVPIVIAMVIVVVMIAIIATILIITVTR